MAIPSPYFIGGNLDFGSVPQGFGPEAYQQAYQNALSLNQQNYNNILQGYSGLTSNVLGTIEGIEASEAQDIEDAYAKMAGTAGQSLVSRGLGNTTVANSVQRGIAADKSKSRTSLANKMAALQAGYRSQLGTQQLAFQERVNSRYPEAEAYWKMQMQKGAMDEARRNRGGGGGGIDTRAPTANVREAPRQQGRVPGPGPHIIYPGPGYSSAARAPMRFQPSGQSQTIYPGAEQDLSEFSQGDYGQVTPYDFSQQQAQPAYQGAYFDPDTGEYYDDPAAYDAAGGWSSGVGTFDDYDSDAGGPGWDYGPYAWSAGGESGGGDWGGDFYGAGGDTSYGADFYGSDFYGGGDDSYYGYGDDGGDSDSWDWYED